MAADTGEGVAAAAYFTTQVLLQELMLSGVLTKEQVVRMFDSAMAGIEGQPDAPWGPMARQLLEQTLATLIPGASGPNS